MLSILKSIFGFFAHERINVIAVGDKWKEIAVWWEERFKAEQEECRKQIAALSLRISTLENR